MFRKNRQRKSSSSSNTSLSYQALEQRQLLAVDCGCGGQVELVGLNKGIAVSEDAGNDGFIMYSVENVKNRFGLIAGNADHFVAVRYQDQQWQYNDNVGWLDFEANSTDLLVSQLSYPYELDGQQFFVGGMEAGYSSGDLDLKANRWDGVYNSGEYEIEGTYIKRNNNEKIVTVGDLNFGIAANDNASGTGFLMYSAESVHERFDNISPNNADHFVAVRYSFDEWSYSDNSAAVEWERFEPNQNDLLIATVDFDSDVVTSLLGAEMIVGGVSGGFVEGDLTFAADRWNGQFNDGEFQIEGTLFRRTGGVRSPVEAGNLGLGVASTDNATGLGYMMYSHESVHDRFNVNPGNADHFIPVRLTSSGGWQYNDNSVGWIDYSPEETDLLMAEINFSQDKITSLKGVLKVVGGIQAGFRGGDLSFIANRWDGATNPGEFSILGSRFEREQLQPSIFIGAVNNGVAVADDADWRGYLMYSADDVQTRFGLSQSNARHFVAVRQDGNQWQYNDDVTGWKDFTSRSNDLLVAKLDFTRDLATELQGTSFYVNGILAGYSHGDLSVTPNSWNGEFNNGEFEISGNYIFAKRGVDHHELDRDGSIAHDFDGEGIGYLMYSPTSLDNRLYDISIDGSDEFVEVRYRNDRWQYLGGESNEFRNDKVWYDFLPREGDVLIAEVDFSDDSLRLLIGFDYTVNGIAAGYFEGDVNFVFQDGELKASGRYFGQKPGASNRMRFSNLGLGVAVTDDASGRGYMMYSEQSVQSRFGLIDQNAENFVAVRYSSGNWQYNDNTAEWTQFTPVGTDVLVASIDFSLDRIVGMAYSSRMINGIHAGYHHGDLTFKASVWNGAANSGEFFVGGTYFDAEIENHAIFFGEINSGIAVFDSAVGKGYLMYSATNLHERFSAVNGSFHPDNAENFVAVQYQSDRWMVARNSGFSYALWDEFTPQHTDVLVAEIDFSLDSISDLAGRSFSVEGIQAGYLQGDLVFAANFWNGSYNQGEFDIIAGTHFYPNTSEVQYPLGDVNSGVAISYANSGIGYFMYSAQSVHERFDRLSVLAKNNADHLVSVQYLDGQWRTSFSNETFTPRRSDFLVAEVDFDTDSAKDLLGQNFVFDEMAVGYDQGSLTFIPNSWAGNYNDKNFEVLGAALGRSLEFSRRIEVGDLRNGVAIADNISFSNVRPVFLMYSAESVQDRFGIRSDQAEHFVGVRYLKSFDTWQFNNNVEWNDFIPEDSDVLIAEIRYFGVSELSRVSADYYGIDAGYFGGDLQIFDNVWAGNEDEGELYLEGSHFWTQSC